MGRRAQKAQHICNIKVSKERKRKGRLTRGQKSVSSVIWNKNDNNFKKCRRNEQRQNYWQMMLAVGLSALQIPGLPRKSQDNSTKVTLKNHWQRHLEPKIRLGILKFWNLNSIWNPEPKIKLQMIYHAPGKECNWKRFT